MIVAKMKYLQGTTFYLHIPLPEEETRVGVGGGGAGGGATYGLSYIGMC